MCRLAVMPGTKLQEHSGSEKAWVYSTVDFAEEEQKMELFCLRFGSLESECLAALRPVTHWPGRARRALRVPACAEAQEFKKHFEEAMAHNDKVLEEEEQGGEARCPSFLSLPQVVTPGGVAAMCETRIRLLRGLLAVSAQLLALQRKHTAMCSLSRWAHSSQQAGGMPV